MSERYLLDDGALDAAMIRRWAYDIESDLAQQDEDLLLHDWEFAELIFELAADLECPRGPEVIRIWDEFARNAIVHQRPSDIARARRAISLASDFSGALLVRQWIEDQNARLAIVDRAEPVTREQALQMGHVLLNGVARSCAISVILEDHEAFDVELSVPGYSHIEWLRISKATGRFKYSRYWPKDAAEPSWFNPAS